MARCFPFPPLGYTKDGLPYEAWLESIKLRKEADKTDRKKEKKKKIEKKEKREKKNRKKDEKLNLPKKQIKKEKIEKNEKREKENRNKDEKLKLPKKQIPNSVLADDFKETGLTEEPGQPIKPSHSSDSTQNCNKRKDDGDVLVPDNSTGDGMPIKSQISKKQKGSDSSNSNEDAIFNTAPRILLSVPTSLTQKQSNPGLERTKTSNPNRLHVGREHATSTSSARPILPSRLKNSNDKVLKSSRQQIGNSIERMKTGNPNGLQVSREQATSTSSVRPVLPSKSEKRGVEVLKSSKQTGNPVILPNPGLKSTKISNPNEFPVGKKQAPASTSSTRPTLSSGLQNNDVKVLKSSRQQIGSSGILPNQGLERTKTRNSNEFIPLSRKHAPASTSNLRPNLPSGLKKSNVVEGLKSSRQQTGSSAIPVRPGHLKQEALRSSISRTIGSHGLNFQQGPTILKPPISGQMLNKPGQSSTIKRPISEVTIPEGPSTELKKIKGPTSLKPSLPGPILNKPGQSAIGKWPISDIRVSDHPSTELGKKKGPTNLKLPLPGPILNKLGPSSTKKRPISEVTVLEGPSTELKKKKVPTNLKSPLPDRILNKSGPSSTGKAPISKTIVSEGTSMEQEKKKGPTNLKPPVPGPILSTRGPLSIGKRVISEIRVPKGSSTELENIMGPTNLTPSFCVPIIGKLGPSSTGGRPISEITVPKGPFTELEKKESPTNLKPLLPISIINKPGPSSPENQPISEITVSELEELLDPTNMTPPLPSPILNKSGPSSTEKRPISPSIEPEKKKEVGPTRSEKKKLKAEYEKLIGSWDPAVIEALQPPPVTDDEDWLFRRTKTENPSKSRGDMKTCELVASTLWQPRAQYFDEVDIYALPYTIPFS